MCVSVCVYIHLKKSNSYETEEAKLGYVLSTEVRCCCLHLLKKNRDIFKQKCHSVWIQVCTKHLNRRNCVTLLYKYWNYDSTRTIWEL